MHIFLCKNSDDHSKSFLPRWLLIASIYFSMVLVYGFRMVKRSYQPITDLLLLNVSLILGILLRYGIRLENAPNYSRIQWVSIFVVYSVLYMGTFYFSGIYHRYRDIPERALRGIFIAFLFNVFIINFIKQYNFSRIASFYCWGFNSIFISGWRFVYQILQDGGLRPTRCRAVVVGKLSDSVKLYRILNESDVYCCDIVGCIEVSQSAIRGREAGGIHVLGLVDELGDIIKEYSINVVIMIGSTVPYSKVLSLGGRFGSIRPEFKLVPELKSVETVKGSKITDITLIDIRPGGMFGKSRSL